MFVVFTADDAVQVGSNCLFSRQTTKPSLGIRFLFFGLFPPTQSYTIDAINGLLGNRTNPNGCSVKMTCQRFLIPLNFGLLVC